jgi:hypothetical protein
MKNTFEFYPRYSSINAESASEFKKIPANRARVIKAGTPVITFTDILGRNYRFPFRNKKQRAEISQLLNLLKEDSRTLNAILDGYEVKLGLWVNEKALRKELKTVFGFSNNAIDSVLAAH